MSNHAHRRPAPQMRTVVRRPRKLSVTGSLLPGIPRPIWRWSGLVAQCPACGRWVASSTRGYRTHFVVKHIYRDLIAPKEG